MEHSLIFFISGVAVIAGMGDPAGMGFTLPILATHPDGRAIWITPLTLGRARIIIGPPESPTYDDGW